MLQHVDAAGTRKAVVTVAALEFPECWRLVTQAEDEQFERICRQLIRGRVEGRLPMNQVFDPDQPWIGVFTYAD